MVVLTRQFQNTDLPLVIRISENVYGGTHRTAEEWRHAARGWEVPPRPGETYLVAVTREDDRVIAYGSLNSEPWMRSADKRRLELLVDPDRRGMGVGSRLYSLLENLGRSAGMSALLARVEEGQAASPTFLQRRGFALVERTVVMSYDIAGIDAVRSTQVEVPSGIRISSLAEEYERNELALEMLHRLWVQIAASEPGYRPETSPPRDAFIAWMKGLARPHDACFIAHRDGEWIGVSMLQIASDGPTLLRQNLTGVLEPYRRRGVGRALKLRSIQYAGSHGYTGIQTQMDCRNEAMIALNTQVGFQAESTRCLVEKTLGACHDGNS